jgi:hypothetical protein
MYGAGYVGICMLPKLILVASFCRLRQGFFSQWDKAESKLHEGGCHLIAHLIIGFFFEGATQIRLSKAKLPQCPGSMPSD